MCTIQYYRPSRGEGLLYTLVAPWQYNELHCAGFLICLPLSSLTSRKCYKGAKFAGQQGRSNPYQELVPPNQQGLTSAGEMKNKPCIIPSLQSDSRGFHHSKSHTYRDGGSLVQTP